MSEVKIQSSGESATEDLKQLRRGVGHQKEHGKVDGLQDIVKKSPKNQEAQVFNYVKSVWPKYDAEGTGYLNFEQAARLFNDVVAPLMVNNGIKVNPNGDKTQRAGDFSDKECREFFNQIDKNDNGGVERPEIAYFIVNVINNKTTLKEITKYLERVKIVNDEIQSQQQFALKQLKLFLDNIEGLNAGDFQQKPKEIYEQMLRDNIEFELKLVGKQQQVESLVQPYVEKYNMGSVAGQAPPAVSEKALSEPSMQNQEIIAITQHRLESAEQSNVELQGQLAEMEKLVEDFKVGIENKTQIARLQMMNGMVQTDQKQVNEKSQQHSVRFQNQGQQMTQVEEKDNGNDAILVRDYRSQGQQMTGDPSDKANSKMSHGQQMTSVHNQSQGVQMTQVAEKKTMKGDFIFHNEDQNNKGPQNDNISIIDRGQQMTMVNDQEKSLRSQGQQMTRENNSLRNAGQQIIGSPVDQAQQYEANLKDQGQQMTKSIKKASPPAQSPDTSNSQIDYNTPSVHGTIRPILKNKRISHQTLGGIDEQSSLSQVNNQMVNVTAVDDLLVKRSLNFMDDQRSPDNESQQLGFEGHTSPLDHHIEVQTRQNVKGKARGQIREEKQKQTVLSSQEKMLIKNAAPPRSHHNKSPRNQTENQDAPPGLVFSHKKDTVWDEKQDIKSSPPGQSPFQALGEKNPQTVNASVNPKFKLNSSEQQQAFSDDSSSFADLKKEGRQKINDSIKNTNRRLRHGTGTIEEEPDTETLDGKDPSELGHDFVNTYQNRIQIICNDASKDVGAVPNTPAQVQKMLKKVVAISMQGLTQAEKDAVLREHMGEYVESMNTQYDKKLKFGEAKAQKEYLTYIQKRDQEQQDFISGKSLQPLPETEYKLIETKESGVEEKQASSLAPETVAYRKQGKSTIQIADVNNSLAPSRRLDQSGGNKTFSVEENLFGPKDLQRGRYKEASLHDSIMDSEGCQTTVFAKVPRSSCNDVKLADLFLQTGQRVLNGGMKDMSVQNVKSMKNQSLQNVVEVNEFGIQNVPIMVDHSMNEKPDVKEFSIQNVAEMHDMSLQNVCEMKDYSVQNVAEMVGHSVQNVPEMASFGAQNRASMADMSLQAIAEMKAMSIQNVAVMVSAGMQEKPDMCDVSMLEKPSMHNFSLQNVPVQSTKGYQFCPDMQDREVQASVKMVNADALATELRAPWPQVTFTQQNQFPIYAPIDFSVYKTDRIEFEALQEHYEKIKQEKSRYKEILRRTGEDVVNIKAMILEIQESMQYLPTTGAVGVNTYSVEQICEQTYEGQCKIVKFLGQSHALVSMNMSVGLQAGKYLRVIKFDAEEGIKVIDSLQPKSLLTCSNGKYLLDVNVDKLHVLDMNNYYQKEQTLQADGKKFVLVFCFDEVDVFGVGSSKKSEGLQFYDGKKLKKNDLKEGVMELAVIQSNVSSAMRGREINAVKAIKGGSGGRMLCLIEHDDQEETIYEYKLTDDTKRDWIVFSQVITLDTNFHVVSSLINDNKLLIRAIKQEEFLILNLDMKVYWSIDDQLYDILADSDDPAYHAFIPESALDSVITKQNGNLILMHQRYSQAMHLCDNKGKTQAVKTLMLAGGNRDMLVLSQEHDPKKSMPFKLKLQRLMFTQNQKKRRVMYADE